MIWSLLIPSNVLNVCFILAIVIVFLIFSVFVVILTVSSWRKTTPYLKKLKQDGDGVNLITSSNLPLFRTFRNHLICIPSKDGSDQLLWRRTIDAEEIFHDSDLAPSFCHSRLFLAIPGILTGLGVLGTFVGLQMGIGGLDIQDRLNLEKSIVPLIQGCAVAFSTSVYGIAGSLFLSFIEKFLGGLTFGRIRKLEKELNALIPRYVPEEAMSDLARSSQSTEDLLKGLAVAIGDEMQKAIGRLGAEIKDAVANATTEGQAPLMEKSVELLSSALTSELGKLKDEVADMGKDFSNTSKNLSSTVRELEPTINNLSEIVGTGHYAVVDAVNKLKAHESVMAQMTQASSEIHQAAQAFLSMKETLQQSADSNENAAHAQLSASQANTQVAEKFGQIGERLPEVRQTLEDAARVISSISGPIGDLKEYLEPSMRLKKRMKKIDNKQKANATKSCS